MNNKMKKANLESWIFKRTSNLFFFSNQWHQRKRDLLLNTVDSWTMWVWTAWVHFQIYFKSKYYITIVSVAGWILRCGGTGDMEGQTTISYTRISPVQFSRSVVSDSATPQIAARQDSLSITNSQSLLKPMSIGSVCHPTISSSVISFFSCPQPLPASGSFPVSQFSFKH